MTKHLSSPAPPRERPPAPPAPWHAAQTSVVEQLKAELVATRKQLQQTTGERDALVKLVNMARDAFIEENSDGETDCVTPYDWYGIAKKEGIGL